MTQDIDDPSPAAPAKPRPTPWSAVIAGAVIFIASGAFLYSLDLAPPERTKGSASAKPPILGLDDPATKRAEQRETARRPRVVACREQACEAGQQPWCDLDVGLLACCPVGKIATPTKSCACPPGGSTTDPACPPPQPSVTPAVVLGRKGESFSLCRDSANRRAPVGDVTLAFSISAEGVAYDIVVTTTGAKDATFEDCMSGFIEELTFTAPLDGHQTVRMPWSFGPAP